MGLLKLMSKRMGVRLNVKKYAPSWKCLKKFGGVLSIDEFRTGVFSNQNTNIQDFPIISRKSEIALHQRVVPQKRVQRTNKKTFYLKKTKKKSNSKSKNSLENSMGIKFL